MVAAAALAPASAWGAALDVEIRGLRPDGGPVIVALFSARAGFPRMQAAQRRITVRADAEIMRVPLGEVGSGVWALAVHHDQDGDGVLDFRWFPPGPAEGTSASCPRRPLAMPAWSSCSFLVGSTPMLRTLEMWYPR